MTPVASCLVTGGYLIALKKMKNLIGSCRRVKLQDLFSGFVVKYQLAVFNRIRIHAFEIGIIIRFLAAYARG
jgi:hypothetical protein